MFKVLFKVRLIFARGLARARVCVNEALRAVFHVRGIPFELKLPNKETKRAMEELDAGNVKVYDSMKDLWNEVDND